MCYFYYYIILYIKEDLCVCLWSVCLCVSVVCVIRMDGQTARRILTKISEWIAIYPRGNIGGRYLPNNPLMGRPHGVGLAKFNRRASGDHVCLLVAASSEFNININIGRLQFVHSPAYGRFGRMDVEFNININIGRLQFVHSPAYGRFGRMDVHLFRPLAGLPGNAGYLF